MSAKKKKKTKSADKKGSSIGNQARTISENRKARHRYEMIDELECGVMLIGSEVKSLREGKISLDEAYVRVIKNELWLVGADIAEYRQASFWNHESKRLRKLLVKKKEFERIEVQAFQKGLTIIPLRIYFNGRGLVKVIIGVGRGKKLHDKRESLKTADAKRRISREMKERSR
jgi:SsrA-binding protein